MSISRPTDGMGVFCVRCNAEMDPDAGFCPNCGEPRLLNETVIVPDEPTRVIEEVIDEPAPVLVEDRPTIPPWAAAVIGVLATLLIVLLFVLLANRNDNNASTTTTTTVPTVPTTPATAPPPAVITVPVPVVVTPAPTAPPTTSPPATTTSAP